MIFASWWGRTFGHDDVQSVERIDLSLAAPWAHRHPGLVLAGCAALAALAAWFYLARQTGRGRLPLAALRGVLLCLLLLLLAEPTLVLRSTLNPKPLLWLVFDGTESMAIEDEPPESEKRPSDASSVAGRSSRLKQVQSLLEKKDDNVLQKLSDKFRLKAFQFDRPEGVRPLDLEDSSGKEGAALDPALLTAQLSADGPVTAIGSALTDLSRRHAGSNVAGVLLFSDFDQNSGPAPLAAARSLGAPIYTVGVGPESAQDMSVDLSVPPLLKKAERSVIVATLRQTGLEGRSTTVRLFARRLADADGTPQDAPLSLGEKTVQLAGPSLPVEFMHTPDEPGRYVVWAEADPLSGEIVEQNNRAEREISVRDDFLRLMFVEYEPTWEWRFIKEVFHRDKLVGMRGFRTYLRSADPKVRQTNELFLETLAPPRSEFFANDVIFLGDMPASALSARFCEMTKEFVGTFGGGLVVLSGPRFGPGQLAETPLADMLPVVVDPESRLRDDREFPWQLTAEAGQIDFMRLGSDDRENAKAWGNLGRLPWYQPVSRLHPFATALAEHPQDTCVDGKTPQPLLAIRRYGRGEVVYLATNETWRLRRLYGELYYRQFWGQMIHRLGLSHAPGAQKRFVVRTDRQQYQADEQAILSVEAYDLNFEPLSEEKLSDRKLIGELVLPPRENDPAPRVQPLSVPQSRAGLFEARIPLLSPGEYLARVRDPITGDTQEARFQAANVSIERRSAVRNASLERELAFSTGGKNYNLETLSQFAEEVDLPRRAETRIDVSPIAFHRWLIWPCFLLLVMLMLGEWLGRKWVSLP